MSSNLGVALATGGGGHTLVMIIQFLIGGGGNAKAGGLTDWIKSTLNYGSLLPRLLAAIILWWLFSWLDARFAASFFLLATAGYGSLVATRVVADIVAFRGLGRILGGMWLPISIMAVAAYLLFFNEQGRELGLSLMDTDLVRLSALALVLIYWALSAWLSARLGLSRVFPEPGQRQTLLFWGPRLVGVLAHFLAAWSLSSAALKDSKLAETRPNVLLAFAAPGAIALAILFVWFLDKAVLSQRTDPAQRASARRAMWLVAVLEGVLLIVLGVTWSLRMIPNGLFWGTLAVSVSAMFFLSLISWIRRRPPLGQGVSQPERARDAQTELKTSWIWGGSLAAFMIVGTVAIWKTPMEVGNLFGSLTVAFFAFGSFLSGINLLDLTADFLARDCNKRSFKVSRPMVWGVFIGLLVVPAILMSATRNYHRVRLCGDCTPAPTPAGGQWVATASYDKRPTVAEAAQAWYRQAAPVYHALHPGEPVPFFIISTAGGGIRAAYWTATVLETLETARAAGIKDKNAGAGGSVAADGLIRHLLFAISGVSGGSIGAAAYLAAVHNHDMHGALIEPTMYLKRDVLAPGLASLAFIDIPSNFLPDFGQIDRGEALEVGLEHASIVKDDAKGLLSHSFVSFFPQIGSSEQPVSWRPALLLNATHQETGRRIITSHLKIEPDVFVDSYDALQTLGSDVRLSTAAHNSARFTYISPAGDLISAQGASDNLHGFVIDGGYFENYGAETATELAHEAIEAIKSIDGATIRPVILQISSDPTVKTETLVRQRDCAKPDGDFLTPYRAQSAAWWDLSLFNELSAPLIGIMSVREAHGFIALSALAQLACDAPSTAEQPKQQAQNSIVHLYDAIASIKAAPPPGTKSLFVHLAMCVEATKATPPINPPLGWVLSQATQDKFKGILENCGNKQELTTLEQALGVTD
jgi:hypothetical protein